jgi:hypothetical protein
MPPRFFEDYKKNENKEVVVADEIKGCEAAKQVVRESLVSGARGRFQKCWIISVRMVPTVPKHVSLHFPLILCKWLPPDD